MDVILLFTGYIGKIMNSRRREFPPEEYFSGDLLPVGKAVYDNNVCRLRQSIKEQKVDVNAIDPETGYSLLLYSIRVENKSVFKELLKLGANTNVLCTLKVYITDEVEYMMDSPLCHAAEAGDLFYLQTLLRYGVDPDLAAPMCRAVGNRVVKNRIPMMDLLLRSGADVNQRDEENITPLLVAILNNEYDLVNYLLENNADPFIESDYKMSFGKQLIQNYQRVGDKKRYLQKIQPTLDRLSARGIILNLEEIV